MINKKQSQGFSLVELLVAMLVGLIIISGAFSLHSSTRETQKVSEAQMDMVADARFAIEMIAYDLRHAGMWGGTNRDGLIECKSTDTLCVQSVTNDTPPDVVTGDCADGASPVWAYNLVQPVFATDDTVGNPYPNTCISNAEAYLPGTDVLEVKYADSNSANAGLRANQMYVRSNFVSGRVFVGSPQPKLQSNDTSSITNNYILRAYTYYISSFTDEDGDGIPSLRRAALVNGPTVENQLLISGVADMQVQFGVDLDGAEDDDGNITIDAYVNPDQVVDWTRVYAAKVWLVMRADRPQPSVTQVTFNIAGQDKTYGADGGFRHFMVSSVVNLRNLRQL